MSELVELEAPAPGASWAGFWDAFVTRHWDRHPVLVRNATARPPFTEDEAFVAAAAGCAGPTPAGQPHFTVGRDQQQDVTPYLPRATGHPVRPSDGSFDAYDKRLADQLGGRRYALLVSLLHCHAFPLWQRETAFFAPLWERVGLPGSSAITTLFHGNYENSPVGVHKDRFATFMYVLRGRKRMRFWPGRPWTEPVTSMLDYDPYREQSLAVDAEAGDLLYWPATFYHVGEVADDGTAGGATDRPATSVNVGIPREQHRAEFDLQRFLDPRAAQALPLPPPPEPHSPEPLLAPDDSTPEGSGARGVRDLPDALGAALERLRAGTTAPAVQRREAAMSLECWTGGGFLPAPPPVPVEDAPPLPAQARVRARTPVRWADCGEVRLYAAHGHVAATDLPGAQLAALLDRLDSPTPVPGGVDAAEVRHILATLDRFRALQHAESP